MSGEINISRTSRIALLARENTGKRERHAFLKALSISLSRSFEIGDLVDLATTDQLLDEFVESYRAPENFADRLCRVYSQGEDDRVFGILTRLSVELRS